MSSPVDELIGRALLGRYRVVMPLAKGGMGAVYLARTEGAAGFAKPVVVKRLLPLLIKEEGMVQLFVREARILANLQHPGIVNVLDFGEEEDVYVMVLEYVHGYNLSQWARYAIKTRGHVSFEFAAYVTSRILETLNHAHSCAGPDGRTLEIVHRDISPGNVLIDSDGHVRLADFGIARVDDDSGEYRSTVGTFKGKVAYSAPEVLLGERAGRAADIYSCGVVLLQLLLGNNVFRGKSMAETVRRVMSIEAPNVSESREDVPPEFDAILARALAKEPQNRYDTAGEFATALRSLRLTSEAETAAQFARQIQADFNGDMPEVLSIDPLDRRDAAWRQAQGDVSGRLSSSPSGKHSLPATIVESHAPSELLSEPPLSVAPTEAPSAPPRSTRRSRAPVSRWLWGALAGAVLLAGGAAAVAVFAWSKTQASTSGPEYVIVERGAGPAALPTAGASAVPAPVATTSGGAPAPTAQGPSPTKPASRANPASGVAGPDALSRTVYRSQGRIQGCFQQHVDQLAGRPQLTMKFELDANGKIRSTGLEPASLASTPLGGCLLGVARSIQFPAPGKPMSFRVPVTARAVK